MHNQFAKLLTRLGLSLISQSLSNETLNGFVVEHTTRAVESTLTCGQISFANLSDSAAVSVWHGKHGLTSHFLSGADLFGRLPLRRLFGGNLQNSFFPLDRRVEATADRLNQPRSVIREA